MPHRISYFNLSDIMKSLTFLAFVQAAIGAAVTNRAVKEFTLNVANADLAPDGFTRSLLFSCSASHSLLIFFLRYRCRRRPIPWPSYFGTEG